MWRVARTLLVIVACLGSSELARAQSEPAKAPVEHAKTPAEPAKTPAEPVPSPPAQSEYDTALSQALDAHANGDYAAARLFMEKAHALEPSARTLRGLAIVALAQGRHLDAIRKLDAALVSEIKPLSDDLRANVQELLLHAWAQVGRYDVLIDPAGGDFLVDGLPPDFYAPRTVVLAPGVYTITAVAPDRAPYHFKVHSRPGMRQSLHIVLAPPPPPQVVEKVVRRADLPQPQQPQPAPQLPPEPEHYSNSVRWNAIYAGGLLVATGVVLWGTAYKRLNKIDRDCEDQGGCSSATADARYAEAGIRPLAAWAGVTGGLGALTLIGVGTMELWQYRKQARTTELRVGPGSLTLKGRF